MYVKRVLLVMSKSFLVLYTSSRLLCLLQEFAGSHRCDLVENLMSNNCSSVYSPKSTILYYRVIQYIVTVDNSAADQLTR